MGRRYTQEQRQFFIDFVPGHSYVEIADEFNRRFDDDITPVTVRAYMNNHKLRNGLIHRFQKGHTPVNKGKKMSAEQYEKCKRTMFQKGRETHNKMPIGAEFVDKDGYTQIKISDEPVKDQRSNWQAKQRFVYEQAHGSIPEGHMIIFLDGDKGNFDIDNLVAIEPSIAIRMTSEQLRSENPDITKAGIALAKVMHKISQREGDANEVS